MNDFGNYFSEAIKDRNLGIESFILETDPTDDEIAIMKFKFEKELRVTNYGFRIDKELFKEANFQILSSMIIKTLADYFMDNMKLISNCLVQMAETLEILMENEEETDISIN